MVALFLRGWAFLRIVSELFVFNFMGLECNSRKKKIRRKRFQTAFIKPTPGGNIIYDRRARNLVRNTSTESARVICVKGYVRQKISDNPVKFSEKVSEPLHPGLELLAIRPQDVNKIHELQGHAEERNRSEWRN